MRIVIAVLFILIAGNYSPVSALELSLSNAVAVDTLVTFDISLAGTGTDYYFQAVLRAESENNYFGSMLNEEGVWVDYVSSPEPDYIKSNFIASHVLGDNWQGVGQIRFLPDDPNYHGPGNYELKVRRFTGNSSSPAGASEPLIITLDASLPDPSPDPSPNPSPSPDPSPSPTASPRPSPKASPSPKATKSPSPTPIPSPRSPLTTPSVIPENSGIGTVAGAADLDLAAFIKPSPGPDVRDTPAPEPELVLNRSRARIVILLGTGMSLTSAAGFLLYRRSLRLPA